MESSPSTLFCRSVSFELELTVLDPIIIAPTNSLLLLNNNCREQREAEPSSCPTIIEVEKEDQQSSQILIPKREEDEPELNHTNKKSSSSSDYHFRDLLINQLKFYASWYLLEITSPPLLTLPLTSTEANVGSEGEDADGGVLLSSLHPPPLLHHQQNNGVIKIRGIAISKNKKPSRWTGLVSLLAADHEHPQNFLIGEGSFVKEINMKNLKSLFTKLLYSSSPLSSSTTAAAAVRQKRSSSSSST